MRKLTAATWALGLILAAGCDAGMTGTPPAGRPDGPGRGQTDGGVAPEGAPGSQPATDTDSTTKKG